MKRMSKLRFLIPYFLQGGVVFISKELAEHYIPKFWKKAGDKKQKIQAVANGSISQLKDLVQLVATNQVRAKKKRTRKFVPIEL